MKKPGFLFSLFFSFSLTAFSQWTWTPEKPVVSGRTAVVQIKLPTGTDRIYHTDVRVDDMPNKRTATISWGDGTVDSGIETDGAYVHVYPTPYGTYPCWIQYKFIWRKDDDGSFYCKDEDIKTYNIKIGSTPFVSVSYGLPRLCPGRFVSTRINADGSSGTTDLSSLTGVSYKIDGNSCPLTFNAAPGDHTLKINYTNDIYTPKLLDRIGGWSIYDVPGVKSTIESEIQTVYFNIPDIIIYNLIGLPSYTIIRNSDGSITWTFFCRPWIYFTDPLTFSSSPVSMPYVNTIRWTVNGTLLPVGSIMATYRTFSNKVSVSIQSTVTTCGKTDETGLSTEFSVSPGGYSGGSSGSSSGGSSSGGSSGGYSGSGGTKSLIIGSTEPTLEVLQERSTLVVNVRNLNPGPVNISVYDLSGKQYFVKNLLLEESYPVTERIEKANHSISQGMYILKVSGVNTNLTRKLVVN